MKKRLTSLLELQSDDQLFETIISNFKNKITQWSYFVNWEKVLGNISPIEIAAKYRQKIEGFNNQGELDLFLAEEPVMEYGNELKL